MPVFHYLHVRAFAHETEDREKVRRAVRSAAHDARVALEETEAEGAHGNRVLILEGSVKSAQAERALFQDLARDDAAAFARLVDEVPRRLDENLNFHLRLDKQEALAGRTVLARVDDAVTVRAKVRSFPKKGTDPVAEAMEGLRTFLGKMETRRVV